MNNLNQPLVKVIFMIFFSFFMILSTSFSQSGADPSIRDWGAPPYQSPDVWCENDGIDPHNDVGEPSKGYADNWLVARIRNLGSVTANNVKVTFAYAPYGAWDTFTWASYADFKLIDEVTLLPLNGGEETTVQIRWDLSDLSENNGGKWAGYSVGDFNHFCVWIKIEYTGEGDLKTNNEAHNNFTSVPTAAGESSSFSFMVSNHSDGLYNAAIKLPRTFLENWHPIITGVQNYQKFQLRPHEKKRLTLKYKPPVKADLNTGMNVDVSLMVDNKAVGGFSFRATNKIPAQIQRTIPDAMLSPCYLIGTFDKRNDANAWILILNPTGRDLLVKVAFFDDNEQPLICIEKKLSANDLWEIDLQSDNKLADILKEKFGVVKAVSFSPENGTTPKRGIAGYQRHSFKDYNWTEAPMFSVPTDILVGDLKYILQKCNK